jgi:hypothetical protein
MPSATTEAGRTQEWLVRERGAQQLLEGLGADLGVRAGHDRVPLALRERTARIDGLTNHAKVLGVVGDREKVERGIPLALLAEVFHRLAGLSMFRAAMLP